MSTLYRHLRIPRTVAEIVAASRLPHHEVVDALHRLGRQVRTIRPTTILDRAIRYQWDGPPPEPRRPAPVAVVAAPVVEAEPVVVPAPEPASKPETPGYDRLWAGAKIKRALDRIGCMSVREISAETGIPLMDARNLLRRMALAGEIRELNKPKNRSAAVYSLGAAR
jgi:hypothetical protein